MVEAEVMLTIVTVLPCISSPNSEYVLLTSCERKEKFKGSSKHHLHNYNPTFPQNISNRGHHMSVWEWTWTFTAHPCARISRAQERVSEAQPPTCCLYQPVPAQCLLSTDYHPLLTTETNLAASTLLDSQSLSATKLSPLK